MNTNETPNRDEILNMLAAFAAQRPGLEFGNYGDVSSYRSEMRGITKDLNIARKLIAAVRWRSSIGAPELMEALRRAFSGRLTLELVTNSKGAKRWRLDYCTGQYWPVEYRRAVCAVLASALWDYTRANMPEPQVIQHGDANKLPMRTELRYGGKSAGDWLRAKFRAEFGRGIASRYFN